MRLKNILCCLSMIFLPYLLSAQAKDICILDLSAKNAETTNGNVFSAKHILKSGGYSFFTTDSINVATQAKIIFSTSNIESFTFSSIERDSMRSFINRGGIWIATNDKDPLLYDCFGISGSNFNSNRFYLNFNTLVDSIIFELFDEAFEKQIRFGDSSTYTACIGTRAFNVTTADTLAAYETGEVAITHNQYGAGHVYQLGTQLKEIILRPQVKEDYKANRSFSNDFEPGQDVFIFMISGMLKKHLPFVVTKHSSYCNSKSTLVITHDVDATSSMEMFDDYASYEKLNNISSTYLITTHYNHDKLAKNFFDGYEQDILRVFQMGHDIQSHSVSHVPDFDIETTVAMGSPGNNRFNYNPYYNGTNSSGVTVFGEAEVSRDLLKNIINKEITFFRPGYLAFNNKLINVLDSLHYPFSSSHSANNVMTNFPFFSHTDLDINGKETGVLEIPNTISDVISVDPINQTNYLNKVELWSNCFKKNYNNSLSTVLLIHPTRYYKLHAQQLLIQSLPGDVFITNLEDYGNFWINRDSIEFEQNLDMDTLRIKLSIKAEDVNENISFIVSGGRNLSKIILQDKNNVILNYTQSNWNNNDIILHSNCERPNYNNYSIGKEPSINNVFITPNPSGKNGAQLHFELMEESEINLALYDSKGSTLYNPLFSGKLNLGPHDIKLPHEMLSEGVYLIKLIIGNEVYKLKWIAAEK